MRVTAGHPSLRSRVADRLLVLKGEGSNALARRLGVSIASTSRWDKPEDFGWHVVEMAIDDAELRDALNDYIHGLSHGGGDAVRVRGDLFQVMTSCTELMHEVAVDLKDGKVDRREAVRLLKLLRRVVELITERVIPDLEALHA